MPFKQFIKRRKLGEGEDDWCDALNDLHLDSSSSSDEYFDAQEVQIPMESTSKGIKRKKTKNQTKNKKQRSSETVGNPFRSAGSVDKSGGNEVTHESHHKQQIYEGHSKSRGFPFIAPSIFKNPVVTKITGLFNFGSESNTASSSSSYAEDEMEAETGGISSESNQEQIIMNTKTGALSETKLAAVVDAIGGDVSIGMIRHLCTNLNFSYKERDMYFPYHEIQVDSSRIMSMLRSWRDKTSETQPMPKLSEALRRANLHSAADILKTEKDPISVAKPKNRGQFEYNAPSSSSSVADHKTGVQRGMKEPPSPDAGSQVNKGGISEEQLEKLADDLHRKTSRNSYYGDICLLGQHLGFTNTNVFKHCGYEMQNDSDGILCMLKAWKEKTRIAHQRSDLIGALERANLSDLASNFHHFQKVVDHSTDFQKGNISGSTSKVPTQEAHLNTGSTAAYSGEVDDPKDSGRDNKEGSTKTDKQAKKKGFWKSNKDQGGKIAPIPQNRKVTVTLMTSSQFYTINGLKKKLEKLKSTRPQLIDKVKVIQLPYSRIQYYKFTEDVDIMILCHSIENRRFAITNVTDSLYDEFLAYCYQTLGKEKIVVIAHDFPPEAKEVRAVKMDSFKHTQWTTFEKAGLVMICGMMDKKPEMQEEDWASLERFLEAASKPTPGKDDPRLPLPGQKDSRECNPESNKSGASKPQTTKDASAKTSKKTSNVFRLRSQKPIIYLCTSFGLHSVRGLQENLRNFVEKFHRRCEITAHELPYNYRDLGEFRFPSEVGGHDAMILCHSMQNRGFLITDVENSIYDQYLHHCNKVFGKEHVAVIVHDFDCSEEILGIHMDAFQKKQPKTFQLAGFVALARKLDVKNVQLSHEDSSKLENFVMNIR